MIGWLNLDIQSQNSLLTPCPAHEDVHKQRSEREDNCPQTFRAYPVNMSRIAGFLRRTFGIVREHVGTDHLGNKYYLIPEQTTWTGG